MSPTRSGQPSPGDPLVQAVGLAGGSPYQKRARPNWREKGLQGPGEASELQIRHLSPIQCPAPSTHTRVLAWTTRYPPEPQHRTTGAWWGGTAPSLTPTPPEALPGSRTRPRCFRASVPRTEIQVSQERARVSPPPCSKVPAHLEYFYFLPQQCLGLGQVLLVNALNCDLQVMLLKTKQGPS